MPRRRFSTLLALAAGLGLTAGCRDAAPWQAPDWRPERPPQRIVAASILATEVLLEIAPRERIVGVHSLAADPRYSLVVDQVHDLPLLGAEPEQLLAVRPDLVITDAFTRPETQTLLEVAGVPMLRTIAPASLADVATNIRSIGRVCHLDAAANELVHRMERGMAAVQAGADGLGVWHVCSLDGALHTYGRGSLVDAMLAGAGVHNLAAERGAGPFRKLDAETVLAWCPDAVLIAATPGEEERERAWLLDYPGLRLLPCVTRDRLLFVPGPLLGTTSHRIVDAAAFVQAALRAWGHP
ncbi:MAG TPA: ABC transporter substrate-binding protein [Planctomycetota bacterium]|nr:ABC transporter substrate-binding protein [Planctomycetota bacterium]